jgi:hypothetical protein
MTSRDGSRPAPWLAVLLAFVAGGAVVWLALGMNRGLLLSSDVKAYCWPWAGVELRRPLQAQLLTDPVWQFTPWIDYAHRELAAGRLPLWNPHQDGGEPLLGNGISALGSPLLAPALILSVRGGWNLSLLLRVLVAALGAYLLARELKRSRLAAGLAAVVFSLSGPFVAWLEHPQTLTAAWAPLLLLLVHRTATEPSRRQCAALALATAATLAGGHAETALMIAMLAAAYLAFAARSWRGAWATGAGALAGAMLAAPLLLPFAEYLAHSAALGGAGRHPFALPWAALVRFVRPHLATGHPIEGAATVSLIALALLPIGLARLRRERELRFWAGAAAVIVFVVYDTPLARLLGRAGAIYWSRALLLLPLALGLLAAAGLDSLQRWLARRNAWLAVAAACAAVLLACGELLTAARGVHAVTPAAELDRSTPLLDTLRAEPGVFRVLPLGLFLPPDSATTFGLDDVRGYDALAPAAWRRARAAIGRFEPTRAATDLMGAADLTPGGEALDRWNVAYLLAPPLPGFDAATLNRDVGLDLEAVYDGRDGRILRNRRALPRARLRGRGKVVVRAHEATRWVLDVEAAGAATLTLANPYFAGWEVRLDGRRLVAHQREGEPIELPVPGGRHRVEVAYHPASFRVGLALAALAAVALLACAVPRLSAPSTPRPGLQSRRDL